MIIFVDIDGTIALTPKKKDGNLNYSAAIPRINQIEKINKLYKKGHTIVYWTARGVVSKKDYYKLTLKQLKKWGCLFNEFRCGKKGKKPFFDLLIDDKSKRIEEL